MTQDSDGTGHEVSAIVWAGDEGRGGFLPGTVTNVHIMGRISECIVIEMERHRTVLSRKMSFLKSCFHASLALIWEKDV